VAGHDARGVNRAGSTKPVADAARDTAMPSAARDPAARVDARSGVNFAPVKPAAGQPAGPVKFAPVESPGAATPVKTACSRVNAPAATVKPSAAATVKASAAASVASSAAAAPVNRAAKHRGAENRPNAKTDTRAIRFVAHRPSLVS
jgi:hypothetical protein